MAFPSRASWRLRSSTRRACSRSTPRWRASSTATARRRVRQLYRQPALARVLDAIGDGRRAFYEGEVARAHRRGVQAAGGCMTADDLASHRADVLEPLSIDYRGHTVYETPPNSQGLILLEELNIIEGYDLAAWGHLSPDAVHHQIEAKKLAFEDRQRFAGDPAFVGLRPGAAAHEGVGGRTP